MRIALSTVCLAELSWREALAAAATSGYRDVELLAIHGWKHVDPDNVPAVEIQAEINPLDVRIIGLHAGALDGLDDTTIARTEQYVLRVFKLAHELGVPLVNINGGVMPKDCIGRQAMLERIATSLRRLAPVLEHLNLRLTLENHFHHQIEQPAHYEGLFVSPRIGATIDTGHFSAAGADMPAFIRRLGAACFSCPHKGPHRRRVSRLGDRTHRQRRRDCLAA
jgi:sugar phosphate isomerase/epimerase